MTAPTDHLAAARAALGCVAKARFGSLAAAAWCAEAQAHATVALAEETRTANLLAALDYGALGHLITEERRAEIETRLWPTSEDGTTP